MRTLVESLSLAIILMLLILAITHTANGTLGDWIASKFQVYDPNKDLEDEVDSAEGEGMTA